MKHGIAADYKRSEMFIPPVQLCGPFIWSDLAYATINWSKCVLG